MIGVLDILVTVVAAGMAGDELLLMVQAQVLRIELEGQRRPGIFGRDRVGVGLHRHPELAVGPGRPDDSQVIGKQRQGFEAGLFLLEQFDGLPPGAAVQANIGHRVQPLAGGRVDQCEVVQFQAGQKILLDVADGVFHAALLVRLAHATGGYAEAEVVGEVLVPRIEDRRFADGPPQHGGLKKLSQNAFPSR